MLHYFQTSQHRNTFQLTKCFVGSNHRSSPNTTPYSKPTIIWIGALNMSRTSRPASTTHSTANFRFLRTKCLSQAVYNHWTGLVDWTSGLHWWTALVDDIKNHFYGCQWHSLTCLPVGLCGSPAAFVSSYIHGPRSRTNNSLPYSIRVGLCAQCVMAFSSIM